MDWVDNLLIDLNSEELPIMDGSAKNFVDSSKLVLNQWSTNKNYKNYKKLFINGEKFISFEPNKISLEIDFEIKNKILY